MKVTRKIKNLVLHLDGSKQNVTFSFLLCLLLGLARILTGLFLLFLPLETPE